MELKPWQKNLSEALVEAGLSREDILPVMLVLTKEEKGIAMLDFLRSAQNLSADEICRKAGEIAFSES